MFDADKLFAPAVVVVAVACGGGGATINAGNTPNPTAQHQTFEIAAHRDERAKPQVSPDEEPITEPTQPLGTSQEEQAFVHVHAAKTTCSGVLVGSRFVFTSRRCTGDGTGARGHEGELRVQIPSGALAWAHRKVEAWVAPACARDALDVALLLLSEAVSTTAAGIASVPAIGTKVRSPGYGTCGGTTSGLRAGSILDRGATMFRVDAALCASDAGAPVLDSAGNAIGIVVRAGHEDDASGHDDPDHPRRHTAQAARLDAAPLRGLLDRARRFEAGDGAAVEEATACD